MRPRVIVAIATLDQMVYRNELNTDPSMTACSNSLVKIVGEKQLVNTKNPLKIANLTLSYLSMPLSYWTPSK